MQPLSANSSNYTRRQALADLMRAENDNDQAVDNLTMIVDSLVPQESLKDATDGFIDVLREFSNNKTDEARAAYRQIDGRVKRGESRTEATKSYVSLMKAENNNEDASGNFSTVDRAVDKERDRTESTNNFNSILREVGTNNTEQARTAFRTVVQSLRPDESITAGTQTFNTLFNAENQFDDALSGYQLVDRSLQQGENRDEAAATYLNVLKDLSSRETSSVQEAYRKIDARVDRGEDRAMTTQAFLAGASAENQIQDALANFDTVSRAVDRGWSRDEATALFNDMLRTMTPNKTTEVTRHYTMILQSLKDKESFSEAVGTHDRLLSAENRFDDVESGYRLIDSVVTDEVSRPDATEYYLSLLNEYGSSGTGKAQEAFRKTHKLILG
jgi:hypothetical protein